MGWLPEPSDADRSQRRDECGVSTLGGHFLGSAAECPSELREPQDRERNSAGHRTPYRWFHPGMDLHLVTLALGETSFSCFNRRIISSGKPANVSLGNYSENAGPARSSSYRRRCLVTRPRNSDGAGYAPPTNLDYSGPREHDEVDRRNREASCARKGLRQ